VKRTSSVRLLPSLVLGGLLLSGCATPLAETGSNQTSGTLCDTSSAPTEVSKLTVLNSGGVLTAPYVEWGIREGCFAKHGLEIISLPGGEDAAEKVAGLVGGSADLASDTPIEVLTAAANSGFSARLVAGGYEFDEAQLKQALTPELVDGRIVLETVLVAGPGVEFEDISSLVGARVGTTQGGGPNVLAIDRLLRSSGHEVGDVEFIGLTTSERLTGLKNGDLQFAILAGALVFDAIEAGGKIALYPTAYIYEPGAALVWFTSAEIAATRADEITSFQLALREVHSLLRDPRNLDNFKRFLEIDFGADPLVVERFSMPKLVTRALTIKEFEYWVPILVEEGIIQDGFTIPADLIFESD
jgi:ABC-type nitrate/sulfonate/bicarbonate transport system substrate-binding protein